MPINIYRLDEKRTKIAWLCDGEWGLPEQIAALETWIRKKRKKEDVECVADIGFKWRKDAGSGGSSLDYEILKRLGEFRITLFLSEYSGFAKEKKYEEVVDFTAPGCSTD